MQDFCDLSEHEQKFIRWYLNRYGHQTKQKGFRIKVNRRGKLWGVVLLLVARGWLTQARHRKGQHRDDQDFFFRGEGLDYIKSQLGIYEVESVRPLPEPTCIMPGTFEKIELLRTRFERGEDLHHEADARVLPRRWFWWEID